MKNYLQILEDISLNALGIEDMKTEIAQEMYMYCIAVYHRCNQVISAKQMLSPHHNTQIQVC